MEPESEIAEEREEDEDLRQVLESFELKIEELEEFFFTVVYGKKVEKLVA